MGPGSPSAEKSHNTLLVDVVNSIGSPNFLSTFLDLLKNFYGASGCAIFEIGSDNIVELESAGANPASQSHLGRDESDIHRIDIGQPGPRRRCTGMTCRKLMLCKELGGRRVALLVSAAHNGPFDEAGIRAIDADAEALFSLVLKHQNIKDREACMANSVTSLHEVESSILTAPAALSRREAEVCARIVYGLTTTGIAQDLGVGVESVATYRKRAYRRMGIATHRELLCWYLDLRARGTIGSARACEAAAYAPVRLAAATWSQA